MAQAYPTRQRVRATESRRYDYRAAGAEYQSPPRPANDNRPPLRLPRPANDNIPPPAKVLQDAARLVHFVAPWTRVMHVGAALNELAQEAAKLRMGAARRLGGGFVLQCQGPGHPAEIRWSLGYPGIGGPGCGQWLGLDGQGVSNTVEADWIGRTTGVGQSIYPFFSVERMQVQSYWWREDPYAPFNPSNPWLYPTEVPIEMAPPPRVQPEISPAVFPSVAPLTAPWVNPARSPDPIPFRSIPRLNHIPLRFRHLAPRQAGNRLPGPLVRGRVEPTGRYDLVFSPGQPVTVQETTHARQLPPAGVKERKYIAHSAGLARKIWIAARVVTESIDAMREVHRALPENMRTKNARPQVLARELWANFDHVDWEKAVKYLIANEMEDQAIGRTSRLFNNRTESAFGSRYIGQGLGTKLNKAYGDHEGGANPFAQLGQWAEDAGLAAGDAAISAQRRFGGW